MSTKSCSVKGCPHTQESANVTFHRFPLEKISSERRELWIRFCGQAPSWKPTIIGQICSSHFKSSSFTKRGKQGAISLLADDAVPELEAPILQQRRRNQKQQYNGLPTDKDDLPSEELDYDDSANTFLPSSELSPATFSGTSAPVLISQRGRGRPSLRTRFTIKLLQTSLPTLKLPRAWSFVDSMKTQECIRFILLDPETLTVSLTAVFDKEMKPAVLVRNVAYSGTRYSNMTITCAKDVETFLVDLDCAKKCRGPADIPTSCGAANCPSMHYEVAEDQGVCELVSQGMGDSTLCNTCYAVQKIARKRGRPVGQRLKGRKRIRGSSASDGSDNDP